MRMRRKRGKVFFTTLVMIALYFSSFYLSYSFTGNMDKVAFVEQPSKAVNTSINDKPKNVDDIKPVDDNKTNEEKKDINEVVINSVGDCTIGWDDKFSYQGSLAHVFKNNNSDYSYFFKNVVDIFKTDDITTANLETTFTNASVKADKEYTFKATPDYVKTLSFGAIEGVNIANNHTRDYLDQGFNDTKYTLKKEKINYFGEGEKWVTSVKGHTFGFLGYRAFAYDNTFLKNLKNDIAALKKQNVIVVINFHWGDEGSYYPNNIQKYVAHYAIDNGADLIIGHHPHVIQGIESYKGKLIAYSLGNFCFGGNRNPSDYDTFILQTKFMFDGQKLKSYGIKLIPCSLSSVANLNNYCPTPVDGSKKDEFFLKINKLSQNLNFKLKDDYFLINVNN